jgi:hypothetical protein
MQAARIVAGTARGHLLHPYDARLPDGLRQFLDLAAGHFGSDPGLAGIAQFEFDGLEVDHGEAFRERLTKGYRESFCSANVLTGAGLAGFDLVALSCCNKIQK